MSLGRHIVFNTWSGAFFHPGGGEVQLVNTQKALEDFGYKIDRFDQWNPQKNLDIYHQFSIQHGTHFVMQEYKSLGKKTALAPILWHKFTKDHPWYEHILNLLNLSDIIFTNSDAESEKLLEDFDVPRAKFHKTRNAITSEYTQLSQYGQTEAKFRLPKDYVLSVANIDTRKNTARLIHSCEELNLPLVLVGAIRDQDYFSSLNIEQKKNVIFLGPIYDPQDIRNLMRDCSVFALPSLCETPGISALEAAAQGAEIVITSEGCAKEYFGDHAFYVEPLEVDSIAYGLILASKRFKDRTSEDRGSIDLRQIDFICDTYTWDKTAEDIIAGYNKIK